MLRQQRLVQMIAVLVATVGLNLGRAGAAPPGLALPAPTGAMTIGRVTYYWKDLSRPELNTSDENDHRELRVDFWYPAEASTHGQSESAPYWPDLTVLKKKLAADGILFGSLKTHALAGPPMVSGTARYPLLLFSPGLGTVAAQYTALLEELVSRYRS